MNTPHKHAEILRAIADGKTIEARRIGSDWETIANPLVVIANPIWVLRIKPETITINGHEVPRPVREPLRYGQIYYTPRINNEVLYAELKWNDDNIDRRLLERGLIHTRKESAIAHAEALLSFTRSDK